MSHSQRACVNCSGSVFVLQGHPPPPCPRVLGRENPRSPVPARISVTKQAAKKYIIPRRCAAHTHPADRLHLPLSPPQIHNKSERSGTEAASFTTRTRTSTPGQVELSRDRRWIQLQHSVSFLLSPQSEHRSSGPAVFHGCSSMKEESCWVDP